MDVVTKSWEDGDLLLYHPATKIKTKAINEESKITSKHPTFFIFYLDSVGCLWHSHGKNPVRLYPKLQSQPIGLHKILFNAILQNRKAHILLKTKTKNTVLNNYVITIQRIKLTVT